jgi:ABC-type Fe3+/spermidine/putrescine transport system ATPase subunit
MSTRPPLVELHRVSKSFGGKPVLQEISLEVREGEYFCLLGASGCGKSTTLRLIAGFDSPDSGEVRIAGHADGSPSYISQSNFVFQNYALFPHMTVAENVGFGLKMTGVSKTQRQTRVQEMLDLVKLADCGARLPRLLSGGQQQRVALARALATSPRMLLLDEPLGALDLRLRQEMQQELKTIQQRLGMTFIHVTHDQEESMALADRLCILDHGRVLQVGTPESVYQQPASATVASFFGRTNLLTLQGRQASVRPENLRFCEAAEHALPARVDQVIFCGSDRLFRLRTASGQPLELRQPSRQAASPAVGDAVWVTWEPSAVVFLNEQ